jgi:broad specificity phosphatase PhoE
MHKYTGASKYVDNHASGFCAFVRHGERADNVDWQAQGIEIEEMHDPPLTKRGKLQA